jgi:hypothetical protein
VPFSSFVSLGIAVKCHEERMLTINRKVARDMLWTRLDDLVNGPCSHAAIKLLRKQRNNRRKGNSEATSNQDGEQAKKMDAAAGQKTGRA